MGLLVGGFRVSGLGFGHRDLGVRRAFTSFFILGGWRGGGLGLECLGFFWKFSVSIAFVGLLGPTRCAYEVSECPAAHRRNPLGLRYGFGNPLNPKP